MNAVAVAVEVTRIVPASGNLALRRQQFWLGPARASVPVTLCVRLKTVPSRLPAADLGQLLAEGGKPAVPSPVSTGSVTPGGPVEVERLVNACGLIALAGRQHPSASSSPGVSGLATLLSRTPSAASCSTPR
jgi:hypothetical protein